MWDLAVREADYGAAEAMLQRMKTPPPPPSMRILLAYARGDSAARTRIFEEARALDSRQSQIGARYVALFLEDFAAADSLARLDLASRRQPGIRVSAQLRLAWLDVARGRWRSAHAAFARAERMEQAPPIVVERALAAALPFLAVPRGDLESIRTEILRWNPESESRQPNDLLAVRLRPQLRLYLLGLLSSRLGEAERALQYADTIERQAAPADARAVLRGLAQTVRADVAVEGGKVDDAARLLASVTDEVPLELVSVPLYATAREFTLEHARHLRIVVLSAQHQNTEALRWIDASFQRAPSEVAYLAPMHLRRAELYERLGERAKAIDHYERFIKLWRDCDPSLQPTVQAAKDRLARLAQDSSGS